MDHSSLRPSVTAAALALMLAVGIGGPARANILTFDNKASFLAATGAVANAPLPDIGTVPGGAGASVTVGDLTFSIAAPSTSLIIGGATDWTLLLPGPDIAISDRENLNVDIAIAGSAFSLGFDFVEPSATAPNINAPFVDSTFTVTLLSGAVAVGSFQYNVAEDIAAFVGVWSNTAFDRVEIRETEGGIDNEFFGQFYIGDAAPVPAPGALALFGLGLAGLGLIGRRRRPAV